MAKRTKINKLFIGVVFTLLVTTLFAQKPRNISGTLIDDAGNGIVKTTVLLLGEDGTEVQRTETSKNDWGEAEAILNSKRYCQVFIHWNLTPVMREN